MGDTILYRIGELAKRSGVSQRTIDYYTQLGLIEPERRTNNNYRYYSDETLSRLKRIESMKKEKYSLEEIKRIFSHLGRISRQEELTEKLTSLQLHLQQVEKEVNELKPIIEELKPTQARNLYKMISPQGAAVIEALLFLLDKGPIS